MKVERTKEWWLNLARREADGGVSAGLLALDPVEAAAEHHRPAVASTKARAALPAAGSSAVDETRIAFARFVELSRRERGMSVEKLAAVADLDVGDIVSIEQDFEYRPDPRTIFQLARTFNVPQQSLMRLAGLAVANDDHFRQEAVRFAARSESIEKLSREQKAALNAFVAVLSEGKGKIKIK